MRAKKPGDLFFLSPVTGNAQMSIHSANSTDVAVPRDHDSFSSIIALMLVLTLACSVIVASLVTFYCRKSQLQDRKLKKAQEEYDKDQGNNAMEQCGGTMALIQSP